MKKHFLIITMILSASLIFSAITLNNADASSEGTYIKPKQEKTYILQDYKGRIALFEGESPDPICVFDIFTASLPSADATEIKNGIQVNPGELSNKIEEYVS